MVFQNGKRISLHSLRAIKRNPSLELVQYAKGSSKMPYSGGNANPVGSPLEIYLKKRKESLKCISWGVY